MSDNYTLDDSRLRELIEKSPEKVDAAIRETAFDAEAIAKANAAVDTGAMRASIFTKTSQGDNYGEAENDALEHNPDVTTLDPTPGVPPLMTAYVAPGVKYAGFVEFGTSKMAAQPFMTPAIEKAEESFARHIAEQFNE